MVNYSTNHISKLESARTNPSYDILVKISDSLDVEIKDLFNFEINESYEATKLELLDIINSSNIKQLKLMHKICKIIHLTNMNN